VLIRESPDDRLANFRNDTALVIRFISRDASSYETPQRALDEAVGAVRRQVEMMDGLYSASTNTMLVPDTNALYWNTALDSWRLPWACGPFIVVLTPTVMKEIDLHKTDERRSSRREKAERIARQVGEYRRRGPLLQGATLATDISTVMAIPVEPKMSDSLPWLDPSLETGVAETLTYMCQPAVVVGNFETRLDRGMYNCPCFTVDREVPHGMSGGPVFWDNLLYGVVSGGLGSETVTASLWPTCLTQFENPKLGELNAPITFQSLFETGQVIAVDWPRVKGNVSYGMEDGKPVPLLRPPE
jgi:hypothetical protein